MNRKTKRVLLIANVYRALAPESFRQIPVIAKLKEWLLVRLGHDWLYNPNYYDMHIEAPALRSAGTIVDSILSCFEARSVIDVGCGTGALLKEFRNRGCNVLGIEYSEAALDYCRDRQLEVIKLDLERDNFTGNRTFDVAVSMEVAEHLPETVSERYVDLLTNLSQVVIFTAAPPGQGGTDHVNEQPPSYWISKFLHRDFRHLEELSQSWSKSWKMAGNVEDWYNQNIMIFQSVE